MADLSKDKRAQQTRQCAKCKAPAVRVTYVTTHYVNGGYSGRTYDHTCQNCKATFSSLSTLRLVSRGFVACLFFFGGLAGMISFITGLMPLYDDSIQGLLIAYGMSGGAIVGGGIYGALLSRSIFHLSANPVAAGG